MQKDIYLDNEEKTLEFGAKLSTLLCLPNNKAYVIYLQGDLGAGKTTMVRGFLRGLQYHGAVKSPTFTLVEPYSLALFNLYHFDFYRANAPEELEYIGIKDYFHENSYAFIEWPQNGKGYIPPADLIISFQPYQDGRQVTVYANTKEGMATLNQLLTV